MVAGDAVHALRLQAGTAEDVAAADHEADLRPGLLGLDDLLGQPGQDFRVDAVIAAAHEGFAGELQQDALVLQCRHAHS